MSRGFRWRCAFGKRGRLRFLSHLELARALERSVRRADLPYCVTQGFSPHMKVAFGPALPVGAAGETELFDVWLSRFVPPAEVLARLTSSTPADLAPIAGRFVEDARPSLSAACTAAVYDVRVPGSAPQAVELQDRLLETARREEVAVAHRGKSRSFDPRAEVLEPPTVTETATDAVARLVLRLGQQGSLRPDALVAAALEYSEADMADLVVTRIGLLEERDGAYHDPLE